MHVMPCLSFTSPFQPAAFAAARLWKRFVAAFAAASGVFRLPPEAIEIAVSGIATAATATSRPIATFRRVVRIVEPSSSIEVRVENTDLRDAIHGKVVAQRGLPDCLRSRAVVDAKRLRAIVADVRVKPGDAFVGVPLDNLEA